MSIENLRRFLISLAFLLILFGSADTLCGLYFGERSLTYFGAVALCELIPVLFVLRAIRAGQVQSGVAVLCASFLLVCIVFAALQPRFFLPLILGPLLTIMVGLSFLSDRGIKILLVGGELS